MNVIAIIPARLASTRLHRKVLAEINGRPMLWHVWSRVRLAKGINQVYVATDSEEVYSAVESWGGKVFMTSPDCQSGTERIVSILDEITNDHILNVQGDEPFIDPHLLEKLVEAWDQKGSDMITPVYPIQDLSVLLNPNVVKVARAQDGRALYFSRSPIPYVRDLPVERWLEKKVFWGHVGVYGYRRRVLENYPFLNASRLESAERLEQLRFLEAGYTIETVETDYRPVAVDTIADLEEARQIYMRNQQ